MSYFEVENQEIEVFESGASVFASALRQLPNHFASTPNLPPASEKPEDDSADEWTEIGEGVKSFAANLPGSTIRFLAVGDREKLPLKKIYWKPGERLEPIFIGAGEFAVVSVENEPQDADFRLLAAPVFVFEYTGSYGIEEVKGLCVGLPIETTDKLLNEAIEWLACFGKACFSPNDDYDYEPQEADFDDSISRLIPRLRGDVLSTNWNFNELKTLIGKNRCSRRQKPKFGRCPNQRHRIFKRKRRRRSNNCKTY